MDNLHNILFYIYSIMKFIILWLFTIISCATTSVFAQSIWSVYATWISNIGFNSRIGQEFDKKSRWTWINSTISSFLPHNEWAIVTFVWSWIIYTWVIWISNTSDNQLIVSYLSSSTINLLYSNTGLQVTQFSVMSSGNQGFYITFWSESKIYKLLWTTNKSNNTLWLEKLNSLTNQSVWKYLLSKKIESWTWTTVCHNKDGFYKNISYEWTIYKFILKKTHQLFAVTLSWNIIELDCGSTISKDYELPLAGTTTIAWGWDNFFLLNNTINKKMLLHVFNISTNTITPLHATIKNIWKFAKEKISWCTLVSQQWDLVQIICSGKKLTYKWIYNVKSGMILKMNKS